MLQKYHAIGNDYLLLDPRKYPRAVTLLCPAYVRRICERNRGLGSDGLLFGPTEPQAPFSLRILNPDGSEAEKSGNGIRIFARYLYDCGDVLEGTSFVVLTKGGQVRCTVLDNGSNVTVDMGAVSFWSEHIPVSGALRDVLEEQVSIEGTSYTFSAATIGNPHCVIPLHQISKALACRLGPKLENHPLFPNRTNVQLLQILNRNHIQIEIWERGAGYTLASGSSSVAAASVAHRLALCDSPIRVTMPGGDIIVEIGSQYEAKMTGPVAYIGSMELSLTPCERAIYSAANAKSNWGPSQPCRAML